MAQSTFLKRLQESYNERKLTCVDTKFGKICTYPITVGERAQISEWRRQNPGADQIDALFKLAHVLWRDENGEKLMKGTEFREFQTVATAEDMLAILNDLGTITKEEKDELLGVAEGNSDGTTGDT